MCLSSSRKCRIFFRAIEMHRKRYIGAECECIAKSMVTFLKFLLTYIAQSLEVSKIRGKNKTNFENFPLFIIDNQHVSNFFLIFESD